MIVTRLRCDSNEAEQEEHTDFCRPASMPPLIGLPPVLPSLGRIVDRMHAM